MFLKTGGPLGTPRVCSPCRLCMQEFFGTLPCNPSMTGVYQFLAVSCSDLGLYLSNIFVVVEPSKIIFLI